MRDPELKSERFPRRIVKGARRSFNNLSTLDKVSSAVLLYVGILMLAASVADNSPDDKDKKTPVVQNKTKNSGTDIRSKLKISSDRSWQQIQKSIPQKKVGFSLGPDTNDGMSGIDADYFCYYGKNDEPNQHGLTTKNDVYHGASYIAKDRPALWSPLQDNSRSAFHTHLDYGRMDNTSFTIKDGEVTVEPYKGVLGIVFAAEQKKSIQAFSLGQGEAASGTAGVASFTIGRYNEPYEEYYALSLWCNEPQTDIALAGAQKLYADK